MLRVVRRLLGVAGTVALASTAFVGAASAPAPAATETFGYTVQLQLPAGVGTQCRLARVDLTNGELTPVGAYQSYTTYACASDLALSPSGVLYGITDNRMVQTGSVESDGDPDGTEVDPAAPTESVHLVRYDTTTGVATDLGIIGAPGSTLTGRPGAGGITVDGSGTVLVYMIGSDAACNDLESFCLYEVDPANPGAAQLRGAGGDGHYLFGLASSCTSTFTLEDASSDQEAGSAAAYTNFAATQLDAVDPATGATTAVGAEFEDSWTVQSLDFASDGTLYGLGGLVPKGFGFPSRIVTIDPATGAVSEIGFVDSPSGTTYVYGLAVSAPACVAPPVEIQPTFTG